MRGYDALTPQKYLILPKLLRIHTPYIFIYRQMNRKPLLFFLLLTSLFCSLPTLRAQDTHHFEVMKHLDIFNSVYRDLERYYVDTLKPEKNIQDALSYMLNQLDPYTEYYSEDETKQYEQMVTGKYAGIGSPIVYRRSEKRCMFSNPYESMPAQMAGVRTGDIIMAIDGQDVGTSAPDTAANYSARVSKLLRGDPNTTLRLTVKRMGQAKPLTFKIVRKNIELPSISYQTILQDSIAYVSLTQYTENTARDLRLALVDMISKGAKRLILDLRDNGGGLMEQSIKIVNFFLPKGKNVLTTKGKGNDKTTVFTTTEEPLDAEMPIVILVNGGTASAAEITSGALQDYDRAVILGKRTFGKGLVQHSIEMPYQGILKYTAYKYYIPSGRCVQAYDFKNRDNEGNPRHLPDSLCRIFHTEHGRIVKDGGGIMPDVEISEDSMSYFTAALISHDVFNDFCVQYRNKHHRILAPSKFHLTDGEYEEFKKMVKRSDFKYEGPAAKSLGYLRVFAKEEGFNDAMPELDTLDKILNPGIDTFLTLRSEEIRQALEAEIVENYYFTRGAQEYVLQYSKQLERALQILTDDAAYQRILSGVPEP